MDNYSFFFRIRAVFCLTYRCFLGIKEYLWFVDGQFFDVFLGTSYMFFLRCCSLYLFINSEAFFLDTSVFLSFFVFGNVSLLKIAICFVSLAYNILYFLHLLLFFLRLKHILLIRTICNFRS